jgi:hypothetical protein
MKRIAMLLYCKLWQSVNSNWSSLQAPVVSTVVGCGQRQMQISRRNERNMNSFMFVAMITAVQTNKQKDLLCYFPQNSADAFPAV